MRYGAPLLDGRLVRRYQRFLADIVLDGRPVTAHCPNSGSMAGLLDAGNPVRVSGPHGGKRKLPYTLEQIHIRRRDGRTLWVGVNTSLPNRLVRELADGGGLPGLERYTTARSERPLGDHSRIDLLLEGDDLPPCWVEVKNCTLVQRDPARVDSVNEGAVATFPDAVTTRGLKHLDLLIDRVRNGERAAVVFTVQRADGKWFAPAAAYDPAYAKRFHEARAAGVLMIPLRARVNRAGIELIPDPLPYHPALSD